MRKFRFLAVLAGVFVLLAASATPATALPGWNLIVSVNSAKCLNADTTSNHVIQWTCNSNAANMNWFLAYVSNNEYELQVDGGGCADVENGSVDDGAYIITRSCDAIGRMLFHERLINSNSGGEYEFVNVNSGKCLNVQGKSVDNGAYIIQWTCNGADNELWWVR